MRSDNFDEVLDTCLNRLAAGDTVAQCIASYPEHAARLEPLMRIAERTRGAYDFAPSPESTARSRARLRIGLAERRADAASRRKPSLLQRLTGNPLLTTAAASIAVVALAVLLVVFPLSPFRPTPPATIPPEAPDGTTSAPDSTANPPQTPPVETAEPTAPPPDANTIAATPAEAGNFAFYVSDAPNDIGDFSSLKVTIDSIELRPRGTGSWVTISPETAESDLVELQGDRSLELWRGNVPAGDYTAAFVHISAIEGILAASGNPASVDLPSDRLHVTADFSVVDGAATEFVFDITVHAAGISGGASRYILQPVASESGVGRPIEVVDPGKPSDDAPGKSGASTESPHGDSTGHNNEDAPSPVEPPSPGPGPGPSSGHPRESAGLSVTT